MCEWNIGDTAYACINGEVVSGKINAFLFGGNKVVRLSIYNADVSMLKRTYEEAEIEAHKFKISIIKSLIRDKGEALKKERLLLKEAEKNLMIVRLAQIK